MADLLDRITSEIDKRLAELKPLIAEHDRLQAAAAALGGVDGAPSAAASTSTPASRPASTPSRRRGRPRTVKLAGETAMPAPSGGGPRRGRRRPGRPKGGGKRAAQALAAITAQPGIQIPELAQKIGVNPTYLYRVVPGLAKEGKVVKVGKGWKPTA